MNSSSHLAEILSISDLVKMAEPLSIASGIAGVITLSSAIATAGYKFTSSVKSAPEELKGLVDETKYLSTLLSQLGHFQVSHPVSSNVGFIKLLEDNILSDIQTSLHEVGRQLKLQEKLQERHSKRIIGSVLWPLKRNDIVKIRERITRLCAIIHTSITSDGFSRLASIEAAQNESLETQKEVVWHVQQSEQEKILCWLSILDHVHKQQATALLRRPSTFDWFFQERTFLDWKSNSKILWLSAPSGAGKTVLL